MSINKAAIILALCLFSMLNVGHWILDVKCYTPDTGIQSPKVGIQNAGYRLGPGDVIAITVDSVPNLSNQYTIPETGKIVFPELLQPLEVWGLTVKQSQSVLVELLTEYMYKPRVTVSILEYHSHKVLVLGSFHRPGKYELKRESVPLLDIILEAGGLLELKENDELVILRNASWSNLVKSAPEYGGASGSMQKIGIDLQALLRDGDLTQNVMVQAGDVIYLTSFFASDQYVYVAGGGHRGAGVVPYEHGLTAFKALLHAGVVIDNPQTLELVIVREQNNSQHFITTRVKFDPVNPGMGDLVLLPEDIVILPESTSQAVYVVGEVNKPGALPYQEDLSVLQAILDAGGMTKEAVEAKVRILRGDDRGRKQIPVDIDAILEKGDKTQNVTLMSGDIVVVPGMSLQADVMVTGKVNTPGIVPYEEGMTAMKAAFLAGGLSGNALKSQIRIMNSNGDIQPPFMLDISRAQAGDAGSSNPVLQPGDLMVILGPAQGNIISVLGKVRQPGIIEYEDGLTALQAVLRAGGFDQGAARSKVKVVRGEGREQQSFRANLEDLVDKGDRSGDVTLLPGDIVIVPETFF